MSDIIDYEKVAEYIQAYSKEELVNFLIDNVEENVLWRDFETCRQDECKSCLSIYYAEEINWEGNCQDCQAQLDEEEELEDYERRLEEEREENDND